MPCHVPHAPTDAAPSLQHPRWGPDSEEPALDTGPPRPGKEEAAGLAERGFKCKSSSPGSPPHARLCSVHAVVAQ